MPEHNEDEWITPAIAAEEMSKLAGYKITTDDIRQLKRTGKITNVKSIGKRITLYNMQEIRSVKPPKKRSPKPIFKHTETNASENSSG